MTYLDLLLGFFKLLFVAETFELVTALDKRAISVFELALLLHGLGDFLTHLFSHFFSHVLFEFIQE
jgi:hypothetical protein